MRTRLKRLFLVVMAIVMTTQCFGQGTNANLAVLESDNPNHLVFQIKDAKAMTVTAMASTETKGDVTVPYKVHDAETQGTKTYCVVSVMRFRPQELQGESQITSVTLTEGIQTIEKDCFAKCNNLASISIPASVTTIGDGIFSECAKLATIEIAEGNQNYAVSDNILYDKDMTKIIYYPLGKEDETVTLASSLRNVGAACFSGNTYLQKIVLPKELESFDPTAIKGCKNLTNFEIADDASNFSTPDGLLCKKDGSTLVSFPYGQIPRNGAELKLPDAIKTVESYAFFMCDDLKNVNLNQVETLKDNAFFRCNMTVVSVPATTTSISSKAFSGCGLLQNINVDSENTEYASVDGVLFNKDKTTLLTFPISHSGFEGEYTIPDDVTAIAEGAFNAAHVKKVTFASSVKTINTDAFSYSSLKEVELNEGLETIGQGAFSVCDLESVHIPSTVTSIGALAFYKMNSQTNPKQTNQFKTVTVAANSKLNSIGSTAFKNNPDLANFTFEGDCDLQIIYSEAFSNCKSLQSFNLPASVNTIQNSAFDACESLTSFTFDDNNPQLKSIGKWVFMDCKSLPEITLPSSITSIGDEAFNKCIGLKKIDIPAGVTSISYSAFQSCENLTNINVAEDPNIKQEYASVDGMLTNGSKYGENAKKKLIIFPAGKANDKITLLSPSFTEIGENAFYNCQRLKNVTIPKKVTKIDDHAFYLCDNLNTIAFLGDEPITLTSKSGVDNDPYVFLGTGNTDILANCKICVRSGKEQYYAANPFWEAYKDQFITSFKVENDKYTDKDNNKEYEEYFPMSDNAVSLLKTTSKAHTLVVPASVKTQDSKEYTVNMIGDYAFEEAPDDIKEVVLEGNIIYIGSWAFNKIKHTEETSAAKPAVAVEADNQIKNIFFLDKEQTSTELSTKRFGLDAANFNGIYNEFLNGQNIYVRKSVYNEVNKDVNNSTWGQYAGKLAYKIPLSFSTTYSTLSREFDVDMSEGNWSTKQNSPKVIAFTSGYYHKVAEPEDPKYPFYIHMTSINCGASEGDGTYIPKNTGVLLKNVEGKGNLPSDFYYQIYDKDTDIPAAPTNNLMQAVVERNGMLNSPNKDASYEYYDFGLGADDMLHRYIGSKGKEVGVHQSYLRLSREDYDKVNPDNPSAVKLCMVFDIDNNTTGIEDVKTDGQKEMGNEAYYTLQGVKVAHPTKGIYVHGGKKVVIK